MFTVHPSRIAGIAILLLFFFQPLNAQTIQGVVRNAETNEPLSGANIVQLNTANGTASQKDGHFKLILISSRSSKIRVSYVGYKTKVIDTSQRKGPLVIYLEPKTILSNAVFVKALRVEDTTPIAHTTISNREIEERNTAKNLPYLLSTTPSLIVTSNDGLGIGYAGIRIRGIDPTRINVTINGIPVNDAESQAVFWVNMPDLASSVESIQIQRGVGSSTNGAAAFGATINIQTSEMQRKPFGKVEVAIGSFNTRMFSVKFGSGLLESGWQIQGRLSKIYSDGYIDRAFSDMKSFYLAAAHHGDNSLLRIDIFSGKQTTYQAWYGVPERKLDTHRTYNPAGKEQPGKNNFYEDQTDNYQQDHYQLHYSYRLNEHWNFNIALFYVYGRGYYEEYKANQLLKKYKISPVVMPDTVIKRSDLIRQQWLNNHFYGTIFSAKYENENWSLTIGGGYTRYQGDHYGTVIWARYASESEIGHRYYFNNALKTDGNIYAKFSYTFDNGLTAYLDMQVRHITYDFLGKGRKTSPTGEQIIVNIERYVDLTFFNPKAGFVYQTGPHRFFASLSIAHREPTRIVYINSLPQNRPQPEVLYDWEFGYQGTFENFYIGVNLYYMDYKHQLVPTGELNDVGYVILQNVPDSYRAGIELQGGVRITPWLQWSGNATFSRNKIDTYTKYITKVNTGTQITRTYTNTTIALSPSFIGSSVLSFQYKGFSADFISKYVSRQYLDNTQTRSRSIDPYFVNDLRLSYDFSGIEFVENIEATLQIINIFNEMYSSGGYTYGYIINGQEKHFEYYYPQAGRHFMAQVSVTF